jgi:hypothetical protein
MRNLEEGADGNPSMYAVADEVRSILASNSRANSAASDYARADATRAGDESPELVYESTSGVRASVELIYDTASLRASSRDAVAIDMSSGEHVYDNPTNEDAAPVQSENYDNLGLTDPIDNTDPRDNEEYS